MVGLCARAIFQQRVAKHGENWKKNVSSLAQLILPGEESQLLIL